MCQLFALEAGAEEIRDQFRVNKVMVEISPRKQIEPTDNVPIIVGKQQERRLIESRWGLFPFWAKDSINADLDGVLSKEIFDRIIKKQRCIIPCTSVCKVEDDGKQKQSVSLTYKGSKLFGMAGLYEERVDPHGQIHRTCTIVTTAPGLGVSHHWKGLPVIITENELEEWLDPAMREKDRWQSRFAPLHAEHVSIKVEVEEPVKFTFQMLAGGRA
ncbi:SOS response-associated peptidase [Paenibacillus tarimensis]|uniref:SOS response-associated peptidase n=1 Tax=Paenibacillus tarimensis TaxID=416012 RepID=UPI001F2150CC|nr:SOS response-associated peptidase family protein [Paenibacillus tarimensis]MCF2942733.1 SOS response-associated peptidase [Paenibacillus tarimensis]